MMSIATVTSKGQITIPMDIRVSLGLEAGDRVDFVLDAETGRVVFLPVTKNVTSLKGMIAKPDTPVSVEAMKVTIKAIGNKARRGQG